MTANVNKWSKTAASNATADPDINWAEGQAPSTVNNSARANMQGIANYRDDTSGQLTLAGGTTVYTLTTNSVNSTLQDGLMVAAVVNAANTGATTLNVDGLGAKNVYKASASGITAIGSGDLTVDMHALFQYDASLNAAAGGWVLLNPFPTAAVGVIATFDAVADANQTMAAGKVNYTWTTLTAARTSTLLAASAYAAGQRIILADGSGNGSSTVTITATVNPAPGTDTIVGDAVVNSPHGRLELICDGSSKFYGKQIRAYGTAAQQAVALDSAGKLPAVDGSQLTGVLPIGYLSGLTTSRASATTFGVTTGQCRNEDAGAGVNMLYASAFTKSLSAWASGTGNGGLDTGAVANNTVYHIHAIGIGAASLDYLYSLSATAPTMPGSYTARRRIGSFKTDGSAQIRAYSQVGDEFLWDAATVDIDAVNPGTAAVTRTLNVPTGIQVIALINAGICHGTTVQNAAVFSSLDVSDQAPQVAVGALTGFSTGSWGNSANVSWNLVPHAVRTNTSAQIRSRIVTSGAADRVGIITRGWIDTRGK